MRDMIIWRNMRKSPKSVNGEFLNFASLGILYFSELIKIILLQQIS
jgi:hypothetical protein